MYGVIEETRQDLHRNREIKRGEEDNIDFFNAKSVISRFNQLAVGA